MSFLRAAVLALVAIATLEESPGFALAKSRSSSRASPRVVNSSSTARRRPPPGGARTRRPPAASRRRAFAEEDDEEDLDVDEEDDDLDDIPKSFDEDEEEEDDDEEAQSKGRKSAAVSSTARRSSSKRSRPTRSRYDEEEDEDEDEDEAASFRSSRDAAARRRSGPPPRRSRYDEDEYEEEEDDEEDAFYERPRQRPIGGKRSAAPPPRGPPPRRPAGRGRPPPPRRGRAGRPSRSAGRGRRSGSVVPYSKPTVLESFTRGLSEFSKHMPDPGAVKEAAAASFKVARETTSSLSSNIYREVKGLTSSELEQVMLKATRPDDTPVKGKHVERLVGVTYQISNSYDIYDSVLRKLWSKMAERDWRTTIKALYILHRFSVDGAPEHAQNLKRHLRELRRTRDPKRNCKYFSSKRMLAGDENKPEAAPYRAFVGRYGHYVLLRAQCFGGNFDEIWKEKKPNSGKSDKRRNSRAPPPKPVTSAALRADNLEACRMLLKEGLACQLRDGEACENTAIAAERVASDLIGLNAAVAIALNRVLKGDDLKGADPALLRKWCEFYREDLQPQTRSMVKKTQPKLDPFGLFLPSRMGTTLSPALLEKGLHLDEEKPLISDGAEERDPASCAAGESGEGKDEEGDKPAAAKEEKAQDVAVEAKDTDEGAGPEEAVEEGADFDDEYEYEEEEYYDDEED